MQVALLALAALAYLLAAALSLTGLVRAHLQPARKAQWFTLGATILLLSSALSPEGLHSTSFAVTFLTVAAAGSVFVIQRWGDYPVLVPTISALACAVSSAATLHEVFPADFRQSPATMVTVMHIGATMVGYLLFLPAFILANLYLSQSWRMRTKQGLSAKLPPLMTLESFAWRLLSVGFVLFTLGILGGVITGDPSTRTLRPQHVLGTLAWLVFFGSLLGRALVGWRGVRAAVTLLIGFSLTTCVVLLYVFR